MASTATPPAPPAARPKSRAQKRGRGSAVATAPLPDREIIPLPETGTWLDVCCAHARWHLAHPERDRLPRTDTIAAAIVARTYLRSLAYCPGHGRERSAVVRTSLRQLIVALGRIWGWDLTDYAPRVGKRERDVVDRHVTGLRRRLRPLLEGGLLEHRVLQDGAVLTNVLSGAISLASPDEPRDDRLPTRRCWPSKPGEKASATRAENLQREAAPRAAC